MTPRPTNNSSAPSARSTPSSLSTAEYLRQPSDDLVSYKSSIFVSNSWKLKTRVKPPGGGVLELYTKSGDMDSYMYELATPSGSIVRLCRDAGSFAIYSYDASSDRTRYITNSS